MDVSVRNAADEEQVARATQTAKRRRETELEDVAALMLYPAGRRFIRRIITLARTLDKSFAAEDTHVTAFNEGQRSIGLTLLADVSRAAPAALAELLQDEHG